MEAILIVIVVGVILIMLFNSNIGKDPSKKTDSMLLREYHLHKKKRDAFMSSPARATIDKYSKICEQCEALERELINRGLLKKEDSMNFKQ